MDQFTYAERATDWRGNNNIAESIFRQLRAGALSRSPPGSSPRPAPAAPRRPSPATSTTCSTTPASVSPTRRTPVSSRAGPPAIRTSRCDCGSRIEGIGRPRMEPSFVPGAIDRMMKVPDAASVAAVRALERGHRPQGGRLDRHRAVERAEDRRGDGGRGPPGSVVTLLCDPGDRYLDKYYSDAWLADQGLDIAPVHDGDRLTAGDGVPGQPASCARVQADRWRPPVAQAVPTTRPSPAGDRAGPASAPARSREPAVQRPDRVPEGAPQARPAPAQRHAERRRAVRRERPPHPGAAVPAGVSRHSSTRARSTGGVGHVDTVGVAARRASAARTVSGSGRRP